MDKLNRLLFKHIMPKQVIFNSILWLTLVSAALLFAPATLLSSLQLEGIVTQYAQYIGLGLIAGSAYLLMKLANYGLDEAIRHLRNKRTIELIEQKVLLLDPTERALLREFFLQGVTVLTLPENEAAVKSLLESNILQSLGNQKHYAIQGPTADYKIAMLARSYLNRQVLRLPVGEPNQEQMQLLLKARPHFVHSMVSNRKHAA
ncbi:superinfection exclusion B family protein [Shewanella sp. Isolate11]|uniref:superinfection exclusion B family protein n=1 Tax=Shewanella sp. Isolate11 TaxID=2908530 RepID=UPI001EFD1815|nr:superinfection exclusion B family protein [Shewanella sp. Isolate11]MCG9695608.1 superinfection exclusion B family protein [Shewanella sp. Isolate11]